MSGVGAMVSTHCQAGSSGGIVVRSTPPGINRDFLARRPGYRVAAVVDDNRALAHTQR